MDGLRWLLLGFGALIIVGVYFYSRRKEESDGGGRRHRREGPGDSSGADCASAGARWQVFIDADR